MRFQEPSPHWNNFTVSDLKDILKHCAALEKLGIAQDEEMIVSIERDIALREKKSRRYKSAKINQILQNQLKTDKIARKTTHHAEEGLLEQKA